MRFAIPLLCLLVAACGEIAWKRGAGADSFQNDQQQCQATGGDYDVCMTQRGWSIYRPEAAEAGVGVAAAQPTQVDKPIEKPADAEPLLAGVATTKDNRGATPGDQPAAKPASRPFDPLAVYNVGSWWKRGGNASDLDRAAEECSRKLGEPHRLVPRPGGGHQATALLIRCLRDQGWYGVGAP